MNVSLTPELDEWVRKKVESGMYVSASEVMREALRLLAEKERHDALMKSLDDAWEEHLRGGSIPISELTLDVVKARAAEKARKGIPVSDDVKW